MTCARLIWDGGSGGEGEILRRKIVLMMEEQALRAAQSPILKPPNLELQGLSRRRGSELKRDDWTRGSWKMKAGTCQKRSRPEA